MKKWFRKKRRHRSVLLFPKMAGTAFLIIVVGSWIADVVVQMVRQPLDAVPWWELLVALPLLLLALWVAYRLTTQFQQVNIIKPKRHTTPRKALIMAVSLSNCEIELDLSGQNKGIKLKPKGKEDWKTIPLSGEISMDYRALEATQLRWNWEPILRGLEIHLAHAEHVRLLVSQNGSDRQAEDMIKLLGVYLPNACIKALPAITFSEPDEVLGEIRHAINELCDQVGGEENIMIDITGGSKTTSIGSAVATLYHPQAAFQYVQTDADKRVLSFNVTASSRDNLGSIL
ncbi:hypothetical protein LRB11_13145 [Ectothiorhodospira haloalkaliphila]|uniref:hypothetical protein n=1 Tax=Ectothiorhodospira haloalkaliphila TaxID=421628 RepID=UPI001EE89E5C|nr:hypothetical protein [Ectothiorhodospira haloalkaliphila]MCG5525867.1 hypothetical protein [Ectothiorhodospira haloalkaliphila]